MHTLPSLHAAQARPPVPHWAGVWLATGTQAPALTQPVQQTPRTQAPEGHEVPSCTGVFEQAPPTHESFVQGSRSSQFLQAAPFVPQLATVVPLTQLCPSQQRPVPVQQLPTQHPPAALPLMHDVPSGAAGPVQLPFWQTWLVRHGLLQAVQKLAEPHWLGLGVTQFAPSQHCPIPQHDPLQQTCDKLLQQVMLLQQENPVPQLVAEQIACLIVPTGSASSTSVEQPAAIRSAAASRVMIKSCQRVKKASLRIASKPFIKKSRARPRRAARPRP